MAYIRIKREKFKVEINKKGYPRVFKSFHSIKDAKKFAKEVESEMERQVFEDYSEARGITLKDILIKYKDKKVAINKETLLLNALIESTLMAFQQYKCCSFFLLLAVPQ